MSLIMNQFVCKCRRIDIQLNYWKKFGRHLSTTNTYCDTSSKLPDPHSLTKQLQSKIKFSGPITVHEYMKEILVNPVSGYYMKKYGIGERGDFVTSPEVSQMFGELIAVWLYSEWYKMGAPKPFKLVEFGPGTGSLMEDILRTFKQFKLEQNDFSIHMIEKSLQMSSLQESKLCGSSSEAISSVPDELTESFKSTKTTDGHTISWHYNLSEVPKGFSMFIAHEFFDALPIHKLKKTDTGWKEILIDIDTESKENQFRYILSREQTPASKLCVNPNEKKDEIEVCPEAGLIVLELSKRIKECGGSALIVDYGHLGTEKDTFRAFRDHKQVSPLCDPGSADVTADVDFHYLIKNASENVLCYGPVSQGSFLRNMGIEIRLSNLLTHCDSKTYRSLINGYKMLVDPEQMGERFKVMALLPSTMKEFYIENSVAGFFRSFNDDK